MKVDIEGQRGAPEVQLVEAIAERPELRRLVDEIYFERHFYFDGKNFGWGKRMSAEKHGTVDDAVRLMHRLRVAGIRAHFWV